MKATRLLLPFTHGVEMAVLEYAVLLAQSHNVTLVALALIHLPATRRHGEARLEHIQQAKDFLEAMRHKAAKHAVPLERYEVFTGDVVQSIYILAQQMKCDGLVLFARGEDGILLSTHEVEHLVKQGACPLYLIRLPSKNKRVLQTLLERLSNQLPRWRKRGSNQIQMPQSPEEQVKQETALSPYSTSFDRETRAMH
ncbi:MAG: hypothetical protein NVSMB27_39350 [Ktedonobacteraceae bacterium]